MSARLLTILKSSIMCAVIALALIGTIYVLDLVKDEEISKALGKVFALLGIYTGAAIALTIVLNIGPRRAGFESPHD